MSVRILIEAVEKYVTGRLLHSSGNFGDHACDGFLGHSNACMCQCREIFSMDAGHAH